MSAMVAVHGGVAGTDQFDRIDFASYAERLVKDVAAGFPNDVAIEFHIEPLTVGPDQALPLGLLINELVSNAFKHGIGGRADGTLVVRLSREDENVQLVIEDNGPGYELNREKGMGSKLVDGFVQQLGGTLSIDSANGTKVVIVFPAP